MVRICSAHELEQFFALPIVDRHRRHNDLSHNIERVLHDMGWLYIAYPHCRDDRCYLYRIIPESWNQYPAAGDTESVTGASNSL